MREKVLVISKSACGLSSATINAIKEQTRLYTKEYDDLHAQFFDLVNAVHSTPLEAKTQAAQNLHQKTFEFYNGLAKYAEQFDEDVIEFTQLKLKVHVLGARTRLMSATNLDDFNSAIFRYGQALFFLNESLDELNVKNDFTFQNEMQHCFIEVMNNKLDVGLSDGKSLQQLAFDFLTIVQILL